MFAADKRQSGGKTVVCTLEYRDIESAFERRLKDDINAFADLITKPDEPSALGELQVAIGRYAACTRLLT